MCKAPSGVIYFCLLSLPQVCVPLNTCICLCSDPLDGPEWDPYVTPATRQRFLCLLPLLPQHGHVAVSTRVRTHRKRAGPLQITTESLDSSQLTCDLRPRGLRVAEQGRPQTPAGLRSPSLTDARRGRAGRARTDHTGPWTSHMI